MTDLILSDEDRAKLQASHDWEGTRVFWEGKCIYCRGGIELVQERLGVSRSEAVILFAAMMHDNASNLWYKGVAQWERLQDKSRPLAERMVKGIEEELDRDKPEDWQHPR